MNRRLASMLLVVLVSAAPAVGWGERGHVAITQAAVELLDAGFPEFVKTDAARARLAYLSVEPDRWRNLNLAPMGHINKPEHYCGIEALGLYGLPPETLPG
ncbi:MAG: hypothetical protein GY842_10120, partial [bacterium]|nr:hypothetical protein [bacterium]